MNPPLAMSSRPRLKVGDQRVLGLAGEDCVLNAVHVGPSVFEVALVLVNVVEVADLVLVKDEWPGSSSHPDLRGCFRPRLMEAGVGGVADRAIGVGVQLVARQHLGVVNGQELDERAGGELQVELNRLVVNSPQYGVLVGGRAVSRRPCPPTSILTA